MDSRARDKYASGPSALMDVEESESQSCASPLPQSPAKMRMKPPVARTGSARDTLTPGRGDQSGQATPVRSHTPRMIPPPVGHGAGMRRGSAVNTIASKNSINPIVNKFLSVGPGRRQTKLGSIVHDRMSAVRKKVQLLYQKCWQVANCQLQASKALKHSPSKPLEALTQKGARYAWPHAFIAPLLWLPFYLSSQLQLRRVLPWSESDNNSRTGRQLATLELGTQGQGISKYKRDTHPAADVAQQDQMKGEHLGSSGQLRKAFWAAVSEARLAQAQSLAAWRDVQSLTAVLDRRKQQPVRRRQGSPRQRQRPPQKRLAGGGGGAYAANAAAVTQMRSQVQAQHLQLKRTEASLKQELMDVERQISRLHAELQRREQRMSASPPAHRAICSAAAADTLGQAGDEYKAAEDRAIAEDRNDAQGVSSMAVCGPAEPLPKFLASARVLPDIPATTHTPRQRSRGTPRTPRSQGLTNIVGSPRVNTARAGNALPSLPAWRCGTAPA